MSVEKMVATIVQRHMEALHDDLSNLLGEIDAADPILGGSVDGHDFANLVGREVRVGLMTTGEYVEWFNEEVIAR